jgi:hypothetical protein
LFVYRIPFPETHKIRIPPFPVTDKVVLSPNPPSGTKTRVEGPRIGQPRILSPCRLLRLTSLAPDTIEAILCGREPDGLSLEKLRKNLPVRWEEQRERWL